MVGFTCQHGNNILQPWIESIKSLTESSWMLQTQYSMMTCMSLHVSKQLSDTIWYRMILQSIMSTPSEFCFEEIPNIFVASAVQPTGNSELLSLPGALLFFVGPKPIVFPCKKGHKSKRHLLWISSHWILETRIETMQLHLLFWSNCHKSSNKTIHKILKPLQCSILNLIKSVGANHSTKDLRNPSPVISLRLGKGAPVSATA